MPTELTDVSEPFAPEINEKTIKLASKMRETRLMQSKQIIEYARELLGRSFRKIDVLVQSGDPSAEIVKIAEGKRADLIAIGCRGLRGIRGKMGSVSRNALCTVQVLF